MARSKDKIRPIKRRGVIVVSMLVSILIFGVIVAGLFYLKDADFDIFKNKIGEVTESFENTERKYASVLDQVTTQRTAVPVFELEDLQQEYTALQKNMAKISTEQAAAIDVEAINAVMERRLSNLETLKTVNTTLAAEELISKYLASYETCKKKVNYQQKSATIKKALVTCKYDLSTAQTNLTLLPKESYTSCVKVSMPSEIIKKNMTNLDYLISYYDLLSRGKAKDAATAELAYRKSLSDLKNLPNWNTCLTSYLQEKAKTLYQ